MGNLYSDIIDKFLFKVEKDRKFFNYYKLTDSESFELIRQRSMNYLDEAIVLFCNKTFAEYSLFQKNIDDTGFENELTKEEIYIITNLMYEIHLKRDLSMLKALSERYSPVDLKVFSPANERKSFMELVQSIEKENTVLLDSYIVRDRTTGTVKMV